MKVLKLVTLVVLLVTVTVFGTTQEEIVRVAKSFGDCLAPYKEYQLFGQEQSTAFLLARAVWEGATYDVWIVPDHWNIYRHTVAGKDVLAEVGFLPPGKKDFGQEVFRALITEETEFSPLLSSIGGIGTVSNGDKVLRIGLYWKPKGLLGLEGLEGPYHRLDFCKVWTSWFWKTPLLDCPEELEPGSFKGALVLYYQDKNGKADPEEFKVIGSSWRRYDEFSRKSYTTIVEISPECWESVIYHNLHLPEKGVRILIEKVFGVKLSPVKYKW